MATLIQTVHAYLGTTGAPATGLSLGFTGSGFYRINGSAASAPAITEIGTTGSYRFTVTLAAGELLEWKIDLGATALSRYVAGNVAYQECLTPTTTADVPAAADYTSARAAKLDYLDAAISSLPTAAAITTAVWAAGARTLTSFGTLAADVWAVLTSALTSAGTIGKLLVDNVNATISSRAASATALSTAQWTNARAALIDNLDGAVSSAGSGAGARAVVVTALDSAGSPLVGARVDVFSGSTLVTRGQRTGAAGTVTVHLDDGSYVLRTTLQGYAFDDVGATVSAGALAFTVAGSSGEAADPLQVGVTRGLDYAAPRDDYTVEGLVEGDGTATLTRTVANVPGGRTIASALLTVKRPDRVGDADTRARLQLTGTVSGTTLTFSMTAAQSRTLGPDPLAYDVQVVLDDGTKKTLELGTFQQIPDVTRT
jgi:hypothetical protein